jgi:hypothetical protein
MFKHNLWSDMQPPVKKPRSPLQRALLSFWESLEPPDIETLAQAFRQYTGPLPDDFPDANAIAELLDPRLSPRRLASRWRLVVQPTNYCKKERLMVIIAFTAAAHGIEKSIPIITKDFRISRSKILCLWKKKI